MFNPESSELLEIKPIEDIGVAPEGEEEEKPPTPPPVMKQNEIFKTGKQTKNVALEVEEGTIKPIDPPTEKKRGVGKRGKDKKKRVKKPLSEKQLAHLAKMRKKAAEKRTAVALEKRRKLEAAKKIVKEQKSVSFSTPSTKGLKTAIMHENKKENVKVSKSVVHQYSNNPRNGGNGGINPNYADFFDLMDKYEEHKKVRNEKIKKEKTLQERLNAKRRNNPHPNRRIPHIQRPAPPLTSSNPFDDIFNYKGRL